MRIALVHHRFAAGGGMERYLLDLVAGFRDAGDTVEVWARDVDWTLAGKLGVVVHRIPVLPVPRLWRVPVLARAVHRLRLMQRADLVISLARTRGQHVHVCGGTHPGFLAAMQQRTRWRDSFEIAAERAAVHESRFTVAHARGLQQELARYYDVAPGRLRVIYPPLDTRRFRHADAATRAAARARFGFPRDVRHFLFPSMGHERKGFDLLLAAFAALAAEPVRLLVAGRAAGTHLPDNVRSLGYVDDMAALYAAVDCTVLPSRYEPFGLVLAESLQVGTPVIASNVTGMTELMTPADGIVLPRLDADAVRDAIEAMRDGRYAPPAGFAERNGLTLDVHVAALRALRAG